MGAGRSRYNRVPRFAANGADIDGFAEGKEPHALHGMVSPERGAGAALACRPGLGVTCWRRR